MARFNVTFERITPESAEHGDADERGFVVENVTLADALDEIGFDPQHCTGPLVEADSCPISEANPPRWFTAYEVNEGTREFFEEGVTENRSLHLPDGMSPVTAMRIAKLLGCYGAR